MSDFPQASFIAVGLVMAFAVCIVIRKYWGNRASAAAAEQSEGRSGDGVVLVGIGRHGERLTVTQKLVEEQLLKLSADGTENGGRFDEVCSICLDDLDAEAGNVFVSPRCRHAFHVACISKWITTGGEVQCPNCMVPFVAEEDGSSSKEDEGVGTEPADCLGAAEIVPAPPEEIAGGTGAREVSQSSVSPVQPAESVRPVQA